MRLHVDPVEYGCRAARVDAGRLALYVALDFGPRVVGLETGTSGNLFARIEGATLPDGTGGQFRLWGGHRLWVAPEVPAVTYRPDDEPVEIERAGEAVLVRGALDAMTGLRRVLELRDGPTPVSVEVVHVVRNEGSSPMRLAPWGLTMLPPGGHARLPLRPPATDPDALQPDRLLVLWPYTDVRDDRLLLGNDAAVIMVEGRIGGGPDDDASSANAARANEPGRRIKIGISGWQGPLSYARAGWRFEKEADPVPGAPYPDLGAAAQVYADERFVEIETLGPLVDLHPGEEVAHMERWRVVADEADASDGAAPR